jgi:DNA-nicking Smr family endonuclease
MTASTRTPKAPTQRSKPLVSKPLVSKALVSKGVATQQPVADPPPVKSRLRRLSDDEIELWLTVAASVTRRVGSALPIPSIKALPDQPAIAAPAAKPTSLPKPTKPLAAPPPLAPLERRLKQKLSRGHMTADAAIDLHGFRQAEAYGALHHFLQRAHRDGLKVVLVVTGKGGRNPDRDDMFGREVGVLKRSVPLWLGLPEFRAMVVGFEEAGRPHGGAGALYIRLRKRPSDAR